MMNLQKTTYAYLSTYLIVGGIGFAFLPIITMQLFLSSGDYGDVMPRAMGMFMIMLGGVVFMMLRKADFTYYLYTIVARIFAVTFLAYLYIKSTDLMFIILIIVVLIGVLPSMYVAWSQRH